MTPSSHQKEVSQERVLSGEDDCVNVGNLTNQGLVGAYIPNCVGDDSCKFVFGICIFFARMNPYQHSRNLLMHWL